MQPLPPQHPPPWLPPGPPGRRPPLIGWDVALSVVALAAGTLIVAFGTVIGVIAVLFLDNCPQETCNADGAITSGFAGVVVAMAVGITGLVLTVRRIRARRVSWPFSVGALLLSLVALAGGATLFTDFVGYS